MISKEEIIKNYSFIEALSGNSECYTNSETFEGHGNLCDIYFDTINGELQQIQIDTFNDFQKNIKKHTSEIEQFITSNLKSTEIAKIDEISNVDLNFDVIQVPQGNSKYDLVLICGKIYKYFLFIKKGISFRVEFKSGNINSIQRKGKWNSLSDNE